VSSKLPNLRQLSFFTELVRSGSFGRTSKQLNVDQPTLTREIRRFEAEFGAKLLERHSKGVVPTIAGNQVASIGEAIIAFSAKLTDLSKPQTVASRKTVIGIPLSLDSVLTTVLFKELSLKFPQFEIDFLEEKSSNLECQLLEGLVDVALLNDPPNIEWLVRDWLFSDTLVLAYPPSWDILSSGGGLRFRQLADLPLILLKHTSSDRRLISKIAAQHGLDFKPVVEVDSVATAVSFVRNGVGASVVSMMSIINEARRGDIQVASIGSPEIKTGVFACFSPMIVSPTILDELLPLIKMTVNNQHRVTFG